jgi:choline dehydrogenase-like flavoprotein
MIQNISTDVLIVGAGFCGRAVASNLNREYLIIDRGEPFGHEEIDFKATRSTSPTENIRFPTKQLGVIDANWQSYVLGGNSNWWGGWASRLTPETFIVDSHVHWPITYEELVPYYERAEFLLNAHGDKERFPSLVGEIPGALYWKEWASDFFDAYITTETKNFTRSDIGLCTGRGTCRGCPENAKTMPWHIPAEVNGVGVNLKEIIVEGGSAKYVLCEDVDTSYKIEFKDIVFAAGGLNNVGLVKMISDNTNVGRYFQDHSSAEILCKFPKEIAYRKIAAEAHLVLDELITTEHGIEIKPLLLLSEPPVSLLNISNIPVTEENRRMFGIVWLQIEIPPEWNLKLHNRGDEYYMDYTPYFENLHLIDSAVEKIKQRLEEFGIHVAADRAGYRSHLGGYHFSGTTAMGLVVDNNSKLIGYDNVYVAGTSVVPRAGGSGPTLTAVALGIKLADHLNT